MHFGVFSSSFKGGGQGRFFLLHLPDEDAQLVPEVIQVLLDLNDNDNDNDNMVMTMIMTMIIKTTVQIEKVNALEVG